MKATRIGAGVAHVNNGDAKYCNNPVSLTNPGRYLVALARFQVEPPAHLES